MQTELRKDGEHAFFPKVEKHTLPEGLDSVIENLDKDAGLKQISREIENYVKSAEDEDLGANILAANLRNITLTINKSGFVSLDNFDVISNPELRSMVKKAAAYEYAFQIPAYTDLDSLENALVQANALSEGGFKFTTEVDSPSVTSLAKEVGRIAELRADGKKILSSSIDKLPEDFGLRAAVKKIVGAANILQIKAVVDKKNI